MPLLRMHPGEATSYGGIPAEDRQAIGGWRRRELNPLPKPPSRRRLRAYSGLSPPYASAGQLRVRSSLILATRFATSGGSPEVFGFIAPGSVPTESRSSDVAAIRPRGRSYLRRFFFSRFLRGQRVHGSQSKVPRLCRSPGAPIYRLTIPAHPKAGGSQSWEP
jgi:hypothetical protein